MQDMKSHLMSLLFGCALLLLTACSSRRGSTTEVLSAPVLPTPPDSITEPSERASYIVEKIWSGVDSLDYRMFGEEDSTFGQFIVDYFAIANIATLPEARESVRKGVERSSYNLLPQLLSYGSSYLGEEGSPLHNATLWATMMEQALHHPALPMHDSVYYSTILPQYKLNLPGERAQDFAYLSLQGDTLRLHDGSIPTLLIFYNPECHTCEHAMEHLAEHTEVADAVARGELKVLCMYLGYNVDLWRKHAEGLPRWYSIGWDVERVIERTPLYLVNTLPTIYLIDAAHRVEARNITIDAILERLIPPVR